MADASPRAASPATVGEAELLRSVSATRNSPIENKQTHDVTKKNRKGKKMIQIADKAKTGPTESIVIGSEGEDGRDKKLKIPITQQYVDHTYTDYAIVEEDDLRLLDENSSLLPNPASSGEASAREKLKGMSCTYGPMKKNAGGVVQPFPGKLLEVLDRSDLVDIIDWMPHGRSFIVKKPKLFTTNVLPRFFKQTKFLSFTRQLNLWGFKRITRGVDAGAYYHELFLRGRPYLAMRMRRQKIKGTGMKLTPNPDGEPDFYNDWPVVPPLNERRVLPPLPPLPAERLGLQVGGPIDRASENMLNALQQKAGMAQCIQVDKKQGAATMDRVSENMLNALKYGAAAGRGASADNVSSFLRQKDLSNFSSFGNQPHQFGARGHPDLPLPPALSVHGPQRYSGTNPGRYDDLLLAPGVSPFENASRLRYLEQHQPANNGSTSRNVGADGLNPNDPIHDELSAMIRSKSQQAVNAAAMGTVMYPPQQLSSDRLLMERLRDLDRAQQIKREQQDMSMLRRARLFDELASTGAAPSAAGVHAPHVTRPNVSNTLSQGLFDQFSYPPPQLPQPSLSSQGSVGRTSLGKGPRQDPFARYGNDPVESSVKDALREANHLEELALAQRAKARSLALAGALQSRFGGGGGVPQSPKNTMDQHQQQLSSNMKLTSPGGCSPSNESAVVGDSRPSFGRPFGRKD